MKLDLSLYLVTDSRFAQRSTLLDQVKRAVDGGVTVVQLREKHAPSEEILRTADVLLNILTPLQVPLLINDHVDIALKIGAQGVHLGQSDMHPDKARLYLGSEAIIGWSLESLDDLYRLPDTVDYVAVSPVFRTFTKNYVAAPLGLRGLHELRLRCKKPLIGIGGISVSNVIEVLQQGVDGVAIVSAILGADDPKIAAEELMHVIKSFRETNHAARK